MLESALEARLVQRIKARGGLAFKLAPTAAGIPDRLVIMPGGRMYLVELKTDEGRVSQIQSHLHRQLLGKGVRVVVLHGKDQLDAWVRALNAVEVER